MTEQMIIKGDNKDIFPLLPKEFVDLVVTSPPYFNQRTQYAEWENYDKYREDMRKCMKYCYDMMRDGGVIAWNIGDDTNEKIPLSAHAVLDLVSVGFTYIDTIMWYKGGQTVGIRGTSLPVDKVYYPSFGYEFIFILQKRINYTGLPKMQEEGHKYFINKKIYNNVWNFGTVSADEGTGKEGAHPAMYPRELVKRCLYAYSKEGDIVLDPFLGSGTTMVECRERNRNCIGTERMEEYIKVIKNKVGINQKGLFSECNFHFFDTLFGTFDNDKFKKEIGDIITNILFGENDR